MKKLLETFKKYINHVFLDINNKKEFQNLYANSKIYQDKLEEYINIIINYYGLSNNERIDIKNRFLHIILKGIIILFSYLYIENELTEKKITITNYITSITSNSSCFIKSTNKINFYEYILTKFINNMFDTDTDTDNYDLGIILQTLNDYKNASYMYQAKFPKIKMLLYRIIPYIQIKNVTNNFITIPQYEGICWFISFLTAICFSDESKKLLLNIYKDKNKENVKNINMITFDENSKNNIKFISILYN